MKEKTVLIVICTLGGGGAERRELMTAKGLLSDYIVKIVLFDSKIISYEVPCEVVDLDIPISDWKIVKFFQQSFCLCECQRKKFTALSHLL